MRDSGADIIAALQAAPQRGLAAANLVWIEAAALADGTVAGFGFWSGRLPVTLDIISAQDGVSVSRTYQGDGALVSVDKIPLTADITVRTTSFVLSLVHPTVRTLWGEYRLKLARVEIHRVPLDPRSRNPVAQPRPRFLGRVDTAPRKYGQPGQEGGVTVNCVSATVGGTYSNPAKRSGASIALRDNDQHAQYAGTVTQRSVPWGKSS